MKLTRVGVDLAKSVFQLHGVDRAERPVWCKRLKRNGWIKEIEQNVELGAEVGMEACGGAHHWARLLQSKGYRVRLIAPQFVKPYVKSNKTDANDAQAVCEAMSRPSMRYVAVKTIEQQDIQAVHRVRASLIRDRGAKANQLRGLAYEYGLVAPREIAALRVAVPAWLEDASNGLTVRLRALLSGLYADLRALDERVRELDKEIRAIGGENEAVGRVQQIRGIGALIASALVAMIGDARQFKNGRHVAVALGLTPRQHSSGSKERILGISKHQPATTGVYAYMRHPQYVGFIAIMFGFLLQWPTILTLVMFPLLVWMYVRLAHAEEHEALREFGRAYEHYAAVTPRWIPHVLGHHHPTTHPGS